MRSCRILRRQGAVSRPQTVAISSPEFCEAKCFCHIWVMKTLGLDLLPCSLQSVCDPHNLSFMLCFCVCKCATSIKQMMLSRATVVQGQPSQHIHNLSHLRHGWARTRMSSMAMKPGWPWTETASNITLDQTEERKKEWKKCKHYNEIQK